MRLLFYRLLLWWGRFFGAWFVAFVARIVALGYFLFSPQVGESRRFYAILFPERSRWYHRWCSFRQYQNFTTIHVDRFSRDVLGRQASFASSGWHRLDAVLGRQGGILLMSHLGNWEVAAALLKGRRHDADILLYMGVKEQEGIERTQKEMLRAAGIRIIGVDQGRTAPFSAVDGVRCLRDGGLVSLAGDVVWNDEQRRVPVTFLGHRAWLPAAPYIFGLVSGAPLFAFFSFRTGPNRYRFSLSEPISVSPADRQDRDRAIAEAAQCYADLLAAALREHPLEWYHFDRFIHEPVIGEGG